MTVRNSTNLMDQVNTECQKRYGCSYSDVDADQAGLDQLDIHGGEADVTAQYFDEQMQSCGKSRIDQ